MKKWLLLICITCIISLFISCSNNGTAAESITSDDNSSEVQQAAQVNPENEILNNRGNIMSFQITSSAFNHQSRIPERYTCDGQDISPPLSWNNVPQGTQSFVLINDDPDAPAQTWDHWILFNIPADSRSLNENIPRVDELEDGSRHGKNSWGRNDYGGPCPPSGNHRYFFKFFAVDRMLDLSPGASKSEIISAIEGHVLAQTELMGTYSRR